MFWDVEVRIFILQFTVSSFYLLISLMHTPLLFITAQCSNFVLFGEREVASGGLIWTWRKMFDRSLFHTEGIWLHSRLIVGQAAQLITSVFLIGLFFAVSSFRLYKSLALISALLANIGLKEGIIFNLHIYIFLPSRFSLRELRYWRNEVKMLVTNSLRNLAQFYRNGFMT